jgi:hypothetical protein
MAVRRAVGEPAGALSPGSPLWLALASLAAVAIFALSAFSIYPLIDGWFSFPLGDPSLFPYRDYFFPVTPLIYLEAQAGRYLSLPVTGVRVSLLVLPALFGLSLASLASRYVSRRVAFVVATAVVALLAALRLEPPGGWNTQSIMFLTLGIALFIKAWESEPVHERRRPRFAHPFSLALALLSGLGFFLAILVKQTVAANVALVLIMFVICMRVIHGRATGSRALRLVVVIVLEQVALAVPVLIFLSVNGALAAFFSDMLSTGGKNPRLLKAGVDIVGGALGTLASPPALAIAALAGVAGALLALSARLPRRSRPRRVTAQVIVAVLAVLAVLAALVALRLPMTSGSPVAYLSALSLPIQSTWTVASLLSTLILGTVLYVTMRRATAGAAVAAPPRPTAPPVAGRRQWRTDDSPIIVALATAVASIVIGVLSSGGTYFAYWFVPSVAIFIAFFVSRMQDSDGLRLFVPALLCTLLFSTGAFAASIITAPYEWWGWNEPPLLGRRVVADFGYPDGLRLSPRSYSFYSNVREAEQKAARRRLSVEASSTLPRTERRLSIFSFPNINSTLTLTSMRPYTEATCLSLWFDLCPNALAARSLEEFRKNPSDVIAWMDPSERAFMTHETLFLGERSALRDWQAYRDRQVRSRAWVATKVIPATATSPNEWPVTIYYRAR